MVRCILVAKRSFYDEKQKDNVLWLTLYDVGRKIKDENGNEKGIYCPKPSDAVIQSAISQNRRPQDFSDFSNIHPGALIDVEYAVNQTTRKSYIKSCSLVHGTNLFKPEDLYL